MKVKLRVPIEGSVMCIVEPYGNMWEREIVPWRGVLSFVEMASVPPALSVAGVSFVRFESRDMGLVVPVRSDVFGEVFVSKMVFGEVEGEWMAYKSQAHGVEHFFVAPSGLEFE